MKISVIISAHCKGRELEYVLTGYAMQTRQPDQIIVAQDGLDMGLRLNHIGVRGVRARHSLVSLHLDHGRSYYCADKERANHDWNRQVRHGRLVLPRESRICADLAQVI